MNLIPRKIIVFHFFKFHLSINILFIDPVVFGELYALDLKTKKINTQLFTNTPTKNFVCSEEWVSGIVFQIRSPAEREAELQNRGSGGEWGREAGL